MSFDFIYSKRDTIILLFLLTLFELIFKFVFRISIISSHYRGKSKRTLLKCNFVEKLFFKDIKFLNENFQYIINFIINIVIILIQIGCIFHLIFFKLIISNIFRILSIIYFLLFMIQGITVCYNFKNY